MIDDTKRRPNLRSGGEEVAERPAIREDNSRDEAAKRAAELRAHRGETMHSNDSYDVQKLAPPGWTYQWHTWSIYEKEFASNITASRNRGWEFVPRERHPELMPKDSDLGFILDRGMVLMMLPTEIVEEYRQAEQREAMNQVRWKEEQIAGTPDGTLPRDHANTRPRINKGFEPMAIPDK